MGHPDKKNSAARSSSPSGPHSGSPKSSTTTNVDVTGGSSKSAPLKVDTVSASRKPSTSTTSQKPKGGSTATTEKKVAPGQADSSLGTKTGGATNPTARNNSTVATDRPRLSIIDKARERERGSMDSQRSSISETRKKSLLDSPDIRRGSVPFQGTGLAKATTNMAADDSPPSGTDKAKDTTKGAAGHTAPGRTASAKSRKQPGGIPETPAGKRKSNNLTVNTGNTVNLSPSPHRTPDTRFPVPNRKSDPSKFDHAAAWRSPAYKAARTPKGAVKDHIRKVVEQNFKDLKEVNGLRVRVDPEDKLTAIDDEPDKDEMMPINDNCIEFHIVARGIHRGLRILETPEGLATLLQVAESFIDAKKRNEQKFMYDRSNSELLKHIVHYLKDMRKSFPDVYMTRTLDSGRTMETERFNWPETLQEKMKDEHPEVKDYVPQLEHYRAKYAFAIYVNQLIVDTEIYQWEEYGRALKKEGKEREKATKIALKHLKHTQLLLALMFARAAVRGLTGLLSGNCTDDDLKIYTPWCMTHPPAAYDYDNAETYKKTNRGDSSSVYEFSMHGGLIFISEDKDDPWYKSPMRDFSSAKAYVYHETGWCYKISPAFIDKLLECGLHDEPFAEIRDLTQKIHPTMLSDLSTLRGARELSEVRRTIQENTLRHQGRKFSASDFDEKPRTKLKIIDYAYLKDLNKLPEYKFKWTAAFDRSKPRASNPPLLKALEAATIFNKDWGFQ